MYCKMLIIMKFAFLPLPLIMLLIGLCLIPFFYKLFRVGLRQVFLVTNS